MTSKLLLTPYKNGRTLLEIEILLDPEELKKLKEFPEASPVVTKTPLPTAAFQKPNPEIKSIWGMPLLNGTPIRAYVLPRTPSVTLNRPIPQKTLLQVHLPGTTTIGYINEQDVPKVKSWWIHTQNHLSNTLTENLYKIKEETTESQIPLPTTLIETNTKLNPFDPNEKAGTRKRTIETF